MGSLANSDAKLYTQVKLKWTNQPVEILSVNVCKEYEHLISINYDGLLEKIQGTLTLWSNRKLSLLMKIVIVNTLIGSMFVYKMSVFPLLPKSYISRLNKVTTNFVWNAKKPKISLKKLQNHKKNGGLGLTDFEAKEIALKISWVKNIQNNAAIALLGYAILGNKIGHDLWKCNLNVKDVKMLFKASFWCDVLECWSHINYKEPKMQKEVLQQMIWLNSHVRIAGKPTLILKAFRQGLTTVACFVDVEGRQIDPLFVCQIYNLDIMTYNKLWSAIPGDWRKLILTGEIELGPEMYKADEIKTCRSPVSFVYKILTDDVMHSHEVYCKWQTILHTELTYESFLKLFRNIYSMTNHSKYM